jgi:phage/plasmid-associated DNA primase
MSFQPFKVKALKNCSDRNIADLFDSIDTVTTATIKVDPKYVLYRWDKKTTLYQKIGIDLFSKIIQDTLREYIEVEISEIWKKIRKLDRKKNKDEINDLHEEISQHEKLSKYIDSLTNVRRVATLVALANINDKFISYLDTDPDVVNFENGLVDLETGKFRKRTENDYFSKTLDFRYSKEKPSKEIVDYVEKTFKEICNNNDTDAEAMKEWFGYCMTGLTDEQLAMWAVGHTASNGKSTLSVIFSTMFSIYCSEFSDKTFEEGYGKNHKQFAEALLKRYVYIEEMSLQRLCMQLLKKLIDGEKIGNNEILFDTVRDIDINFKLHLISNYNANFKMDNGARRRFLFMSHTSNFLSKIEYEPRQDDPTCFLMDKRIRSKFAQPEYKLALFQMLLPYSMRYYDKRELSACEGLRKEWKDMCDENDKMAQFINNFYEITKNENDIIFKDDFLADYKKHYALPNITWANILNDVKRVNINYNRAKERTGKDGARNRGFLIGIKKTNGVTIKSAPTPIITKKEDPFKDVEVESTIEYDD